jgi:hypothetical protein
MPLNATVPQAHGLPVDSDAHAAEELQVESGGRDDDVRVDVFSGLELHALLREGGDAAGRY